jgi:uncharacterized protein with GYD domain
MPTYIMLGNFTQMGIEKIKDAPQRFDSATDALKAVGGALKDYYFTIGRYDFVATVEAPQRRGTHEVPGHPRESRCSTDGNARSHSACQRT